MVKFATRDVGFTLLKLINNSSSQDKEITNVKEVWIPGLN